MDLHLHRFNILENNDDFIIINKPANTSFHNEDGTKGLFSQLTSYVNCQLWPVHRLDKITSGLLIFAKSKQSAALFGQLFETKQIHKTYIAISDKKPKKKQGKISGDMQKARGGSWKLLKSKNNPAVTSFLSCSLLPGKRLFWLTPLTGKTHQLRVALKSISAPILGDRRYTGSDADRGYLHCYRLSFHWKGKELSYHAFPEEGEFFCLPQLKQLLDSFESAPEPDTGL